MFLWSSPETISGPSETRINADRKPLSNQSELKSRTDFQKTPSAHAYFNKSLGVC
jgi:hypothetical protein